MLVEVGPARPGELEQQQGAVIDVLTSRYAVAPWGESPEEITAEAGHLAAEVGGPGVVTAVARLDGLVVGFAQGAPGHTVLDDLAAASTHADLQAWGPTAFELRQLAVLPRVAGRGAGTRLLTEVLRDVHGPALLLTHPSAAAALRLYDRHGWEHLARVDVAPGHPRLVLGRRRAAPA